MLTHELLATLFDARPHPLAPLLAEWLNSSRRFTAFVEANHTKIRKKLRTTRDPESLRDLQLELETAYLLLRERALSLLYEPQPGKLGRSPDFTVTYTTSLTFMIEVTRVRGGQPSTLDPRDLADLLAAKLRQLDARSPNLLLIGLDFPPPSLDDLRDIMRRIQQRAESGDPVLLQRSGYRDRSAFFQAYYRLSGILLRTLGDTVRATGGPPNAITFWDNPQARTPLPSRVRTALIRSQSL
jgi:hypothetical protein